MNPPKRNITEIKIEVSLQELMSKKPFVQGSILEEFDNTRKAVVDELLCQLLGREPLPKDYDLVDIVESNDEKTWKEVYFCDVRIGRIVGGVPNGLVESILGFKDIFIYFYPDEEYVTN